MCALINWFTQRLLHVDITLVQGLIVDFYYDKLSMDEWVVTAAEFCIDFLSKNSLVGYDSFMKKSIFESWKSFMIIFGSTLLQTPTIRFSLFISLWFPIRQQSIILPKTACAFRVPCYGRLKNFADFIYNSASKTTERKLFRLCTSDACERFFMKHFQGGHVKKCKQIS